MDRTWIKYIDLNCLELYPIQFANCDRLAKNDVVYIFDEVGSGKTISSGIMAMDYLYNHDKDVLVITTNALVKENAYTGYGQFINDWFNKLPFQALNLEKRVQVVNNHCSHFADKQEYGLVIIDEAQLFLNQESLRYQNLVENIHADKIVFLTATPIKTGVKDLYIYGEIAKQVTGKPVDMSWVEKINTQHKEKEEIICSTFDATYPVTRYFKDTIMALNAEGFKKTQARRLLPELWRYSAETTKLEALRQYIVEAIERKEETGKENRFIVFTRLVKKEAYAIQDYLCENGFEVFGNGTATKTVKVITGENAAELGKFKGTENLPTVLIVTYQIAEQGVNLPGFNYVVNYHISAFPSALEQRFGRIDRMGKNGSVFEKIHMCFLIPDRNWDTNKFNFYYAVSIYRNNLISYLPSKNTILSESILEAYQQDIVFVEEYIKRIRELSQDAGQLRCLKEYYKELNKRKEKCIGGHFEDWSELECACEKDLFEFVEEYGIEYRFDEKDAEELLCNEIKEKLKELKAGLRQQDRETTESCKAIINKVSCDKIFYLKKEEEEGTSIVECLQTVDAIEDCSRHIFEQKEFGQYRIWFEREIRLNVVVQNYWKELNRFFERKFEENEFSVLFPMAGYRNSFEIMFQEEEFAEKNMKEEHKELLWNASDAVVSILPFFRMCREYKKLLHSYGLTKTGAIRTKYDFSPLLTAVWNIGIKILSGTITGLSEKFTERYWIKRSDGSLEGLQQKLFYIQQKSDGLVVASNWYKLAYHYLRREEACFIWQNGVGTLRYSEAKNPFYKREEYFKEISEVYSSCGGDGERFEQERYEYKMALQEGVDIPGEPEEYQSFLNCFYYTDSLYNKRKRTYAADVPKYRNMKVNVKDIWTMGIYFDIHGITFQNCVWGNLLPLPKECRNIPIYK